MDHLLIKMAQESSKDSALMASLIQQNALKEGLNWEQMAVRLGVKVGQLAKLALCERPQFDSPGAYAQMAEYAGVPNGIVNQFVQPDVLSKPTQKPKRKWVVPFIEVSNMLRHRSLAYGLAAVLVLVVSAFVLAKPVETEATLIVSSGEAIVIQDESILFIVPNNTEKAVAAGNVLSVGTGDVVKLATGSAAQLRLYDGSTVDIFESTTLKVSELTTDENTYRVRLTMLTGRTVNRVVRALGVGDRFEVHTPSSTASVRGTIFTVDILSDTSTYYACDEGVVHISMNGQGVDIHAGEEITAVLDQTLPGSDRPTDTPKGPPEQVPGNPPAGGGDPPGQSDLFDEVIEPTPTVETETPVDPPIYPPEDDGQPDDNDDPTDPGDESNPHVPEQVPGKPPEDPGDGNPPGGGGTPPGQGGTPPGQSKKDK